MAAPSGRCRLTMFYSHDLLNTSTHHQFLHSSYFDKFSNNNNNNNSNFLSLPTTTLLHPQFPSHPVCAPSIQSCHTSLVSSQTSFSQREVSVKKDHFSLSCKEFTNISSSISSSCLSVSLDSESIRMEQHDKMAEFTRQMMDQTALMYGRLPSYPSRTATPYHHHALPAPPSTPAFLVPNFGYGYANHDTPASSSFDHHLSSMQSSFEAMNAAAAAASFHMRMTGNLTRPLGSPFFPSTTAVNPLSLTNFPPSCPSVWPSQLTHYPPPASSFDHHLTSMQPSFEGNPSPAPFHMRINGNLSHSMGSAPFSSTTAVNPLNVTTFSPPCPSASFSELLSDLSRRPNERPEIESSSKSSMARLEPKLEVRKEAGQTEGQCKSSSESCLQPKNHHLEDKVESKEVCKNHHEVTEGSKEEKVSKNENDEVECKDEECKNNRHDEVVSEEVVPKNLHDEEINGGWKKETLFENNREVDGGCKDEEVSKKKGRKKCLKQKQVMEATTGHDDKAVKTASVSGLPSSESSSKKKKQCAKKRKREEASETSSETSEVSSTVASLKPTKRPKKSKEASLLGKKVKPLQPSNNDCNNKTRCSPSVKDEQQTQSSKCKTKKVRVILIVKRV